VKFYEGTGRNGHSAVLVVDPRTGKISQRHDLSSEHFWEGIVDWGGRMFTSGPGHRTSVSFTTAVPFAL
jgi:glutamine cyclotransferase